MVNGVNYTKPQTTSACAYVCVGAGVPERANNLYCLSTFDLFESSIGGHIVLIIIICSVVLLIIIMMVFIIQSQKSKYKTIEKKIDQIEKAIQNEESLDKVFVKNADLDSAFDQQSSLFNARMRENLVYNNLQFFERDIYQHFSRIYLLGNNSYQQPWRISPNPPLSIRHLIIHERYQQFVTAVNTEMLWSSWESILIKLVTIFYPAILPTFTKWRRKHHCAHFIGVLGHATDEIKFWKNEEDRMRNLI